MITIRKNQPVKDDPTLLVAVPTSDYNETDLIECYPKGGDPSEPTLMCQALYVVFGGAIYQQSEEITKDQVDALKNGTPIGDVINNKSLIDNKEPAAKYVGRVVKTTGPVGPQLLRTDSIVPEEVEEDPENPNVPPLTVTPTSTTTPTTHTSTTTPATTSAPRRQRFNKSSSSPSVSATTTPSTTIVSDDSEATLVPVGEEPVTNADLEAVTDTVLDTVEAVVAPEVSSSAPARQLVSYAKKKIKKRLTQ